MRIKILFYTICILFFLVLQSTLLQYIRIYNVIPNLLVVFIILVALIRGNVEGGAVGFFAGLALDMMFGKLLGFYALLGMYLGVAVGSVNRRLYRENLLVVVFFTFVASVLYETAVYFLNTFMSGDISLVFPMTGIILPEALYNSVAAVFLYALVLRVNRRFEEASKAARKY
jgi:rod shape-determining protein MreD